MMDTERKSFPTMARGVMSATDSKLEKNVNAKTPKMSSRISTPTRSGTSFCLLRPFCSSILRKMTVEVMDRMTPMASEANGEYPRSRATAWPARKTRQLHGRDDEDARPGAEEM